MANALDNAVARLQDLSQAMTSITIKSAPNYPVENAEPAPFSIAYVASLIPTTQGSGMLKLQAVINVDFYFNAVNIKQAYTQMDAVFYEFPQRFGGDPTLNATVSTIDYEAGVNAENLGEGKWGDVAFYLLRFVIPIKINTTTL